LGPEAKSKEIFNRMDKLEQMKEQLETQNREASAKVRNLEAQAKMREEMQKRLESMGGSF